MSTNLDFLRSIPLGRSDCIIYPGGLSQYGYGQVKHDGRNLSAHRVAYELHVGPIPEGLVLDHLCRNRACVNPAHMEPVTNRENVLRGRGHSAIAASRSACAKGHEYAPETTYITKEGHRVCRVCMRMNYRQRYLRRRERLRADSK